VKRASRALRTAAIWTTLPLLSGHALAEDSPTQKPQAAKTDSKPSPSPASTDAATPGNPSPEQAASNAYQKALASYAKGDVTAALNSMQESYELSKRAELLYNLACLEEELKACGEALSHYRRYLELVPQGHYRKSAEQARERLEQQCPEALAPAAAVAASAEARPNAEPTTQPSAARAQATYWSPPRIIGWSAIAAGTLSGAGALYFQREAVQAKNEFQQSVDEATSGAPIDTSLQDRQHRYNHAAIGLGITAGALVASGLFVLLLAPGEPELTERSASLSAAPGWLGASYAQRF